MDDFQTEMAKVASESWRLLKLGKRVTLGIGDNRKDSLYQAVAFRTLRTYLNNGFVLDEMIIRRQRFNTMAPLGVYLCTHYDFLMFAHEYVFILKKVSAATCGPEWANRLLDSVNLPPGSAEAPLIAAVPAIVSNVAYHRTARPIPSSPIERHSIVMGTLWTVRVTNDCSLSRLAMSKLVQRFGKDDAIWEEVSFLEFRNKVLALATYHDICAERDTPETCEPSSDAESDCEFEQERQKRIEANHAELSSMGLIFDLSAENQEDTRHLSTLLSMPPILDFFASPHLVFIPHINVPPTAILSETDWILNYRRFLVEQATDAANRIKPQGYFIVGVKDVRCWGLRGDDLQAVDGAAGNLSEPTRNTTTYVPLTLLVQEDLTAALTDTAMRLKEVIVIVPQGYSRNKDIDPEEFANRQKEDEEDWQEEREAEAGDVASVGSSRRALPIVQALYYVYLKV
ncbi:hypothetical protein HK097_006276 [Rhizophlyctis rosea]|uniref:Uncharacterized protein n=1 Tax=Rhizophlyctis rosea TaxID=64517 RepID=A0AAD5SKQ2_9FUNG|nr:hypothetical protein HK097_006276 [Rhizophlyctis rosea]